MHFLKLFIIQLENNIHNFGTLFLKIFLGFEVIILKTES